VYTFRIHSIPLCGGALCFAHLVRRKSPQVPDSATTVAQNSMIHPAREFLPTSFHPSASCVPLGTRKSGVSVPALPSTSISILRWFAWSGFWPFLRGHRLPGLPDPVDCASCCARCSTRHSASKSNRASLTSRRLHPAFHCAHMAANCLFTPCRFSQPVSSS